MSDSAVMAKLEELRRSFDESFAEALRSESEVIEDMLNIRVAGDAYAVRLNEIAGLYPDRKVVSLPSPLPELLGLAGFRGNVIPIFDLAACLGYARSGETGRWVLLTGTKDLIGLAFQKFEGRMRTSQRDLARREESEPSRQHVHEVARAGDIARPIINLASVAETINRRVRSAGRPEGAIIDGS